MTLNQKQKDRIKTALQSGSFNLEAEVEHLVEQGFTKEDALLQIKAELAVYRQQLFDQKLKSEDQQEYQKMASIGVVMVAMLGPVFDVSSIAWYIAALFIAGGLGYWAYKDKPIAGIVGSICMVIVSPVAYYWYISGRTSIIKIELLIPMGLAMIPSFFIGWIIYKAIYSER